MKWELGALKILARNPTVSGIALQDAISEIEKLQKKLSRIISKGDAMTIQTDSTKWILIADQLPADGEIVLVYSEHGEERYGTYPGGWYSLAFFDTEDADWIDPQTGLFIEEAITHWTPLIKPPEKEAGE